MQFPQCLIIGAMHMITASRMLLSGLLFAAIANPSYGQINKCVDGSGKTIYSHAPCPVNTKASNIRAADPIVGNPASAAKDNSKGTTKTPPSAAELERDFRKRRAEQEEAAKKNAEKSSQAKEREENCKSARGQLASLESGARQQRVDEKGERVFMDDSQLPAELDRARRAVQSWCN